MSAADRPLVLVLEPFRFSAEKILRPFARLHFGPFKRSQLLEAIERANILWVRLGHRIDRQLLDRAPRLRCIVSPTTGLNHIDLDACARHHVKVLSLRGETGFLSTITATAEHSLGLILALLRHTIPAHASVCRGQWDRHGFMGREASKLTLGILGMGRLGRILARLARPMFHHVLGCDPYVHSFPAGVQKVSLGRLAEQSDVISIHVPSSPKTRHLVDGAFLRRMKRNAYLVNTSRGDLIDEKALLAALRSGRLAGAALDVLEAEHSGAFRPAKEPLVRYARNQDNLIITPHLGGATAESLCSAEIFMAEKLRRHWRHAYA